MSTLTITLPDDLVRSVSEQNSANPSWIEMALRKALSKTASEQKSEEESSAWTSYIWPEGTEWWPNGQSSQKQEPESPDVVEQRQQEAIDWLTGCLAGSKRTVEDFLAECHADKERELAIEKRQREESKYYAAR